VTALAATGSQAALARLTASSTTLGALNAWLLAGVEDRQSTFLRAALRMLRRLPLSSNSLQNVGLAKTVAQLQKYRWPSLCCLCPRRTAASVLRILVFQEGISSY
jgi:hypothetical protein